MPHLLEGINDGDAVSTAHVNSSCLSCYGGSDDVLERFSKDVDGSVDAVRVINPSKVVMDGNAARRFGLHEVRFFERDLEDNVSGVEANDGVGICVEVAHEVCLFHGVFGSFGLIRSYLIKGDEDAEVGLAVEY